MSESQELQSGAIAETSRSESLIERIRRRLPNPFRGRETDSSRLTPAEINRYSAEILAILEIGVDGWEMHETKLSNGRVLRDFSMGIPAVGPNAELKGDINTAQLVYENEKVEGSSGVSRLIPVSGNATVYHLGTEHHFEVSRGRHPKILEQSAPYHQEHVYPFQMNTRGAVEGVKRILLRFPDLRVNSGLQIQAGETPK